MALQSSVLSMPSISLLSSSRSSASSSPPSFPSFSCSCLLSRQSRAALTLTSVHHFGPTPINAWIHRSKRLIVRMAPEEERMTRRSPLDFPIEWERPKPGRRPDIFPQFSPMKTPLPPPLPADPPEEDEEEEEKKEEEEEDTEKEESDKPEKQ